MQQSKINVLAFYFKDSISYFVLGNGWREGDRFRVGEMEIMQALINQNCLPTFAYTSRIKTIK